MTTLFAARPDAMNSRSVMSAAEDASEFYHYVDTGCEVSDSCLDCPLPRCRYDDPVWYQRNRRLARDFRIVHTMQREALSIDDTAERFGITNRTVFRILQRCREATMQDSPAGELALAAA